MDSVENFGTALAFWDELLFAEAFRFGDVFLPLAGFFRCATRAGTIMNVWCVEVCVVPPRQQRHPALRRKGYS